MSHCRWVVVAEDCFDQLRQLSRPVKETVTEPVLESDQLDPPVRTIQTGQAEQATDIPVTKPLPDTIPESRVQRVPEPELRPEPQPEPAPEQESEHQPERQPSPQPEEENWTSSLPPSYRGEGKKLLEQLLQTDGFHVSETGLISVDGVLVEDYTISSFLRTTCIPFNRNQIPFLLQEWLRTKGIVKFRNHLAKVLPKWIKRYSWRESTMAKSAKAVKGPLEDQKRSIMKR